MTPQQTIAISVIWIAVFVLATLVLLLYRQVDRAYRGDSGGRASLLIAGSLAPEIEVLDSGEIRSFDFSANGERHLAAFVKSGCGRCEELLGALIGPTRPPLPTTFFLIDGAALPRQDLPVDSRVFALAHPADVIASYGLAVVPAVYVLKGRSVLAAKSVWSSEDIAGLLDTASTNELDRVPHAT